MKKPLPVDDIIQTDRLPAICPACGVNTPRQEQTSDGVYRLHCRLLGCGWSAKYALTPEVSR